MLPSKPRSGLSDTLNNKTVPSNLNPTKITRAQSTKSDPATPPLQRSRSSPKTVESKPATERRSPKFNNPTSDKPQRAPKRSEVVHEDLKKAKEQLAYVEQAKARLLEELKDAKKLAEEAIAARKRAEEKSESEKFRAEELEQADIESTRKREDELESVKKKHLIDLEALHSLTEELEKVKNELEVTGKTKDTALSQAENANKIAEINAEEVSRLKSLLGSKLDTVNSDAGEVIKKLELEIDSLRSELQRAKESEEKLVIMEALIENLSTEVDSAKSAEVNALKSVDEWTKKAELFEIELTEAKQSEKSSSESLAYMTKQLEETSGSLQDYKFQIGALREKVVLLEDQLKSQALIPKNLEEANALLEEANILLQDAELEATVLKGKIESLEIEVADLKKENFQLKKRAEFLEVQVVEANQLKEFSLESLTSITMQLDESHCSIQDALSENAALRMKIESLETEITRYKEELVDSEQRLHFANEEAIEMGRAIKDLQYELRILEEEKLQALNNESFSEERKGLLKELEMARNEEEKAKKAMEGLDSALREVSAEARETQERLFTKRVEHEDAITQIEQLRLALKNTKENYEVMLDESRYEIVCLQRAIDEFDTEVIVAKAQNFSSEIEEPEELESTVSGTMDSEEKVNELPANIEEAATGKSEENGELSNSENEYHVLPNSDEIPLGSINGSSEEIHKLGQEENGNGNEYLGKEEPVEVEVKMLEGYRAIETEKSKDFSSELDNGEESVEEESELKIQNGSFDNTNGLPSEITEDRAVSPRKHQQKKKPFIRKFGNLLKKKNTHY